MFQDLFVDRLVERVDKLKEEIAMYEAQLTAQLEETKVAKEALMEAHMEIEVRDRPIMESDHGCTSRIYFDYAADNVTLTIYNVMLMLFNGTLTSQKPC